MLVTFFAKVIQETFACVPKVVLSRSAAVTPMTVRVFTWLSPAIVSTFAVETPVMVKPVVMFLVAIAEVYCAAVNTVLANVKCDTRSSAATIDALSNVTPLIVKPEVANLPFALAYSALLKLVTPLANVSDVTLASVPKVALSRSAVVTPETAMPVT